MTNLSDLLPAGAGAKSATFTASGTLSSGQTVALQSDGTAIAISETSASTGSVTNFDSGTAQSYQTQSVVYDVSQSKILITYADKGNSSYLTAIVGTVSGTSISFGTATVIESQGISASASVYCPDISKTCCFYKKSSDNYSEARVLTISGTSVSTSGSSGLSTPNREAMSPVFDPDNNKVIFNYRDESNSRYGTTQVCTVTSTTVTAATAVVWASVYAGGNRFGAVYDTLNDKVVVSYIQDTATPRGKSVVGTVSGTSTSWGTPVEFNAAEVGNVDAAFDSNANKVVIVYRDSGSGSDGTVIVGTVSGTSISFGSETVYASGQATHQKIVYDTGAKKSVLIYTDTDGGTGGGGDGRIVEITVDGTTATAANDARVIDDARYDDPGGAYDSSVGRVVFAFRDTSDNDNDAIVHQTFSTNFLDFVGITDEAISDTATGSVVVEGGQITNSALVAEYLAKDATEIFESANVEHIAVVYDSNAQKSVIFYADAGDGDNGTAVVATISNGSISYGTPVVFNNAGTTNISAAYDSTAQKIVVAFRDGNNSFKGSGIVGTVSGTSISFGSSAIFETGTVTDTSTAYDANADRIVIAYKDQGNSNYGTSVVGTVSGTSISFGSPVVHQSSTNFGNSIAYDSNAQKVVLVYTPSGSGQGVVGTVSGTSISYGSPTAYESSGSASTPAIVYDANAQKVVVVYRYSTGKSVVGTVSGTSISFGTAVEFDNNTTVFSAAYNSSSNTVFVSFEDGDNSNYGTIIEGTVSGTSISFGDSLVFEEGDVNYLASAYDANANRVITAFRDEGNSNYGTAATVKLTQDLIVGSTYYVQSDGSLSTTSSSVTAGKALSATKLLLKG